MIGIEGGPVAPFFIGNMQKVSPARGGGRAMPGPLTRLFRAKKLRGRRQAGWGCDLCEKQFMPAKSFDVTPCHIGSKIAAPGGVTAIARRRYAP